MANETRLFTMLQFRRDNVFTADYVLQDGEPGFEISTNTLKIGKGGKKWSELEIANKEAIDALIKVVDDKVAALGDTYATDEEVRVIKEALEAAIALKVTKTDYDADKATFALKTDVATEFAKYTTTEAQSAIDAEQNRRLGVIEGDYLKAADIADFETKENVQKVADDLADVKATADAAAVKADVDAALAERYTKTEADGKFETIANVDLVRADVTNITKDGGLIATAKSEAIAAAKTETETQISTFKTTVTDVLDGRIEGVEEQLANVSNVMDFVGAGASLPAAESSNKGDVFVINEGDNAGKEYVFDGTTWVEFGYATGNENAIAVLQGRMDAAEEDIADHESRLGAIEPKVEGWDTTKSTVDANKATWDLAGTALQAADLDPYAKTADVVTNEEFTAFEATNTAAIDAKLDKSVYNDYIEGKALSDASLMEYADSKATDALNAAKEYANGLEHKNTTYTVAATANPLEFTVTPSEGDAQTVTLVTPDVGVTKVIAGTDIVVTPEEGTGEVTVGHAAYQTGTIKAAEGTAEPNFVTSVTINNGHVTSATVQTLADALASLTIILDGGDSSVGA